MPDRYEIPDSWEGKLSASLDGSYGRVILEYKDSRDDTTRMELCRGSVVSIISVHSGVTYVNPDVSHKTQIERLIPRLRDAVSRDPQATRWHDSLGHP